MSLPKVKGNDICLFEVCGLCVLRQLLCVDFFGHVNLVTFIIHELVSEEA